MRRESGILMPIFSLPSEYGIGDFGRSSYNFIDFLKRANQRVWQILPLVQTGYGNSPYSSICSTSLNPYFISVENLLKEGLIDSQDLVEIKNNSRYVDYEFLYNTRFSLLRKAFSRFDKQDEGFKKFTKNKGFLDYAIFMAKKTLTNHKPFYEWEKGLKTRDKKAIIEFVNTNKEEVLFWQFIQYRARSEWQGVKKYANKNKVKILGDMPLYVALDSVDVWCNPKLFKIDKRFKPKKVAGVPPDYFSQDGQLWGNPVYNYKEHKKDNFKWWTNRIKQTLKNVDLLRIDHFRALDRFYQIDYGKKTAREGQWVKVPSRSLIDAIHSKVDAKKIIAEDLGIIDDGVRKLLKYTNYPGMKILSFAFNGEDTNPYLPKNIEENSVCFTGTHDNDTLLGLIEGLSAWDKNNLYWGVKNSLKDLNVQGQTDSNEMLLESIIKLCFAVKSKLVIIPMQDIMQRNSQYRINKPGELKQENWAIRFFEGEYGEREINTLLTLNNQYNRNKN